MKWGVKGVEWGKVNMYVQGSSMRQGISAPCSDRAGSVLWTVLGTPGGWDELNVFLPPSLTSFTCSVFPLVFIHLAPAGWSMQHKPGNRSSPVNSLASPH